MADPSGGAPLALLDLALGVTVAGSTRLARTVAAASRALAPTASLSAELARSLATELRRGIPGRLVAEGQAARAAAASGGKDLLGSAVRRLLDAVLDLVDLTELVERRVDLDRLARHLDIDAIVDRLDLDGIAARLDLDRIVDRLDLIARAQEVVEGIDLPRIIRESTGSVASEGISSVRIRSMEADRAVTHFVDRVLFRRTHPARPEPAPDGSRPASPVAHPDGDAPVDGGRP